VYAACEFCIVPLPAFQFGLMLLLWFYNDIFYIIENVESQAWCKTYCLLRSTNELTTQFVRRSTSAMLLQRIWCISHESRSASLSPILDRLTINTNSLLVIISTFVTCLDPNNIGGHLESSS
jgi:hypothetical protein